MKKQLVFTIFVAVLCFFACSCKSLPEPAQTEPAPAAQTQARSVRIQKALPKAQASSDDSLLTERIWALAACYFKGSLQMMDANMTVARIKFSAGGKFEAGSGISSYAGMWKKGSKKQRKNRFSLIITAQKEEDPYNLIGKPFDAAFAKNLTETRFIEISHTELKLYTEDNILLLHFIRL